MEEMKERREKIEAKAQFGFVKSRLKSGFCFDQDRSDNLCF